MRTTLDLNEALLAKAKAQAAMERTTLTRLIEEGLVMRLRPETPRVPRERGRLPVYHGRGGFTAAVTDPWSNRALLEAAEGEASA